MIDIVRRLEYRMLKATSRPNIGKYVPTETQSCQHHDSNLVNVHLSRLLLALDLSRDIGMIHSNNGQSGNKKTECYSMNLARWLAGWMKKDPKWKAEMRTCYEDTVGIPVVKSARFWSIMIVMGQYIYPRLSVLRAYHDEHRARMRGSQFGNNLEDLMEHYETFEFHCLLEAVDYTGFHSPFNYGAANRNPEKQAAFIQRCVRFHKRCITDEGARNTYWRAHASMAITARKLYEYKAKFIAAGAAPTPKNLRNHRLQIRWDLRYGSSRTELEIPDRFVPDVKAMHQAIVTKLSEHVSEIVDTGALPIGIRRSNAPSSNIPVECEPNSNSIQPCAATSTSEYWPVVCRDIFQFGRKMQERSSIRRMAADAAHRRVRKAPQLGGTRETTAAYTLSRPPPAALYPEWRVRDLKRAAREVMSDDWPSVKHRAKLLCTGTQQLAEHATVKAQGRAEKAGESELEVRSQPGGMVGEGEDAYQLPPMVAMTIAMYDTVTWTKDEMLKRKWSRAATSNQLKLRNLQSAVDRRSERLTTEYRRRKLFGVGTKLRVSAPTLEKLANLLHQVLEAEEVASRVDAAAASVVAEAEVREQARTRHSRRARTVEQLANLIN